MGVVFGLGNCEVWASKLSKSAGDRTFHGTHELSTGWILGVSFQLAHPKGELNMGIPIDETHALTERDNGN